MKVLLNNLLTGLLVFRLLENAVSSHMAHSPTTPAACVFTDTHTQAMLTASAAADEHAYTYTGLDVDVSSPGDTCPTVRLLSIFETRYMHLHISNVYCHSVLMMMHADHRCLLRTRCMYGMFVVIPDHRAFQSHA